MNRLRVLSVSLAMSLMLTQTAMATQSAVLITPFGTTTEIPAEAPGAAAEAPGAAAEVPGAAAEVPGATTAAPGATAEVPGATTTAPGATAEAPAAPAEVQAVLPTAVYSTKEPVPVSVAAQAGPEMNSQAAQTNQTAPSPQAAQENQTTVRDVSGAASAEELEAAAKAAGIEVPEVAAEGAILYDVTHDRFLYEKNADSKFYPASITKILTALLVLEHADLNETVTYSENAVTRLESGAVTLQLQEGDKVSVKDSLYGLMLKSANEVANGLAEHVGGTLYDFADMMNAKAASLGCTGSHFVNPNGLNDSDHYTTARDMAKIAAAAFENETLCKITSTTSYKFPATKAAGERTISMGHKMIYPTDSRYYEGIVGGKTGYTSLAGNTLVTCVEQDGVRMVAVILKSRSTHYTDTTAMLDYGYALNKAGLLTETAEPQDVSAGPGAVNGAGAAADVNAAGPGAMNSAGAAQVTEAYHKWIADGESWRFELADGTRLANCLITIDGADYAFDTEGRMVTGWLTLGSNWHYFGSSGAMIKGDWRQDAGLWFYLGENGAMVRNAWVENQYYVGADGVWVE